ncbi:MAG: monofunctional biosynthetic peptidoglycan transglycosylase [Fibrobacteres bacterium]|nr:monofunctional biosynthetic peptidoglycan transglycosylase [Fibrobacterota bacterium]
MKKPKILKKLFVLFIKILLIFVALSLFIVLLFRFIPVPYSMFMVQRKVSSIVEGKDYKIKSKWVSIDHMSPYLPLAVICAEDQLFEEHHGFDFGAITKALRRNAKPRVKRVHGASTITQQMVKNLYLWPSRTYIRKGAEAYLTVLVELLWPKKRIIEVYLNIIELGEGVFGVEAASKKYFGRSSSTVSLNDAALLAAVLPNPIRYKVAAPSPYVLRRRGWITRQCFLSGGLEKVNFIREK